MVVVGGSKSQAQPPTNHFKNLLEEICPNHTYPIKHKLRNCSMMKSFMISGSPSWGMKVDEVPDEGDVMPFLEEEVVKTIYDERPSPRRCACLTLA
jgi:hypothetical protein